MRRSSLVVMTLLSLAACSGGTGSSSSGDPASSSTSSSTGGGSSSAETGSSSSGGSGSGQSSSSSSGVVSSSSAANGSTSSGGNASSSSGGNGATSSGGGSGASSSGGAGSGSGASSSSGGGATSGSTSGAASTSSSSSTSSSGSSSSGEPAARLYFRSLPVPQGLQDQPWSYQATLSRSGVATWTLPIAPTGAAVDSSGRITWTPSANQMGSHSFTVQAVLDGEVIDQSFVVSVAGVTVETQQTVSASDPDGAVVRVDAPLSEIAGTSLVIPPGALESDVDLTISAVANLVPPAEALLAGLQATDLIPVEFGPSGLVFAQPVHIQIPVSAAVLAQGNIQVQTFDQASGRWETVPLVSVDTAAGIAVAEVQHFSTYLASSDPTLVSIDVDHGSANSTCASDVLVQPLLVPLLQQIPASGVAGAPPGASNAADVLASLTEGRALQVLTRVTLTGPDGIREMHALVSSAVPEAGGRLRLSVADESGRVLAVESVEGSALDVVASYLRNERAVVVARRVDAAPGAELEVTAEVVVQVVAAEEADRVSSVAGSPLGGQRVVVTDLVNRDGLDDDCDGLATSFDPQFDVPRPVVFGVPGDVVAVPVGVSASLSVVVENGPLPVQWSADGAVTLVPAGDSVDVTAQEPGLYRVLATVGDAPATITYAFEVVAFLPPPDNIPPRCEVAASAVELRAGEMVFLDAIAHDPDGDPARLTYSWTVTQPASLQHDGRRAWFTASTPGEYVVTCFAYDGADYSSPGEARILVVAQNADLPPGQPLVSPLSSVLDPSTGATHQLYLAYATDPEGGAISFTWQPVPGTPQHDLVEVAPPANFPGRAFQVTPGGEGVYRFVVFATDASNQRGPGVEVHLMVVDLPDNPVDNDRDGYFAGPGAGGDCDDTNPSIHPNTRDLCGDGVDQDCSGADTSAAECDNDGDGLPSAGGDCDDTDPSVRPGNSELCDARDNNCNTSVDEGWGVGQPCVTVRDGCQIDGRLECSATRMSTVCVPLQGSSCNACGSAGQTCASATDCCSGMECTQGICQQPQCQPRTCQQMGATCGVVDDGCGQVLDCGTCRAGEMCGAARQCVVVMCGGPGQPCSAQAPCAPGLACINGVCMDGGACTPDGAQCDPNRPCCNGQPCPANGFCEPNGCRPTGEPCAVNDECCGGACVNGICGDGGTCRPDGASCDPNRPCCNGLPCSNGICQGQCTPIGTQCQAGIPCCNGYCGPQGICENECLPDGVQCDPNRPCCSGSCANGTCAQNQCDGRNCVTDAECCAGYRCDPAAMQCFPDGGGCTPDGAQCDPNRPCCNGQPCSANGTCGGGGQCRVEGEACNAATECCSGNCTDGVCMPNQCDRPCATDAECCAGYRCDQAAQQCYPDGGACTPDGAQCDPNRPCCNNQPCSANGICESQCTPIGTQCQAGIPCCNGYCGPQGVCENECIPDGAQCDPNLPCCSGSCVNGTCAQNQCDGRNCVTDAECCAGYRCDPAVMQCFPDGGACAQAGQPCINGTCCAGLTCDAQGICGGGCGPEGMACAVNAECCSGNCANGVCSPNQCDAQTCATDVDCCAGYRCDPAAMQCFPDGGACAQAGQPCINGTCCAGLTCDAQGICGGGCGPEGMACAVNAECCSGNCANGVCSPNQCDAQTCATDADCCAGYRCDPAAMQCFPDGGGCTPDGAQCDPNRPCCNGQSCSANGTCGGGGQCRVEGEACNAATECCSGNCTDGTCMPNQCDRPCATDAECCAGYRCDQAAQQCYPDGGACTPDGAQCDPNRPCCNNQPCSANGICESQCTPIGTQCQAGIPCCNGYCGPQGICENECISDGAQCDPNRPCCSGSCANGICAQNQCDARACAADAECCPGYRCDPAVMQCFPDGGACAPDGAQCDPTHPCCNGQACPPEGYCGGGGQCAPDGEPCDPNRPCCNGQACGPGQICGGGGPCTPQCLCRICGDPDGCGSVCVPGGGCVEG
ncbi:MAG: hypothetical protein AB2A00_33105 [Myxococcota bacterium]